MSLGEIIFRYDICQIGGRGVNYFSDPTYVYKIRNWKVYGR